MEIRIGDLAKRSGCEVVTIRYYEKEGLLPKPARSGGNFRLYGDVHIERLQFIRHCRSLDMTLSEIRILLGLRDNPAQDCGDVNTLLDAHIRQTEDRVEALLQLKRHLLCVKMLGRSTNRGMWHLARFIRLQSSGMQRIA
jgi:Cd(II)/Pb(II)-responsive transcriptional regulator